MKKDTELIMSDNRHEYIVCPSCGASSYFENQGERNKASNRDHNGLCIPNDLLCVYCKNLLAGQPVTIELGSNFDDDFTHYSGDVYL